jgi:beta-phosphoglucomutase-like phosphatase (HAD superfamily)
MTGRSKFRGALFDMDGLLLDTERLVVRCFAQTTRDMDVGDMEGLVFRMIGLRSDASKPALQSMAFLLHG